MCLFHARKDLARELLLHLPRNGLDMVLHKELIFDLRRLIVDDIRRDAEIVVDDVDDQLHEIAVDVVLVPVDGRDLPLRIDVGDPAHRLIETRIQIVHRSVRVLRFELSLRGGIGLHDRPHLVRVGDGDRLRRKRLNDRFVQPEVVLLPAAQRGKTVEIDEVAHVVRLSDPPERDRRAVVVQFEVVKIARQHIQLRESPRARRKARLDEYVGVQHERRDEVDPELRCVLQGIGLDVDDAVLLPFEIGHVPVLVLPLEVLRDDGEDLRERLDRRAYLGDLIDIARIVVGKPPHVVAVVLVNDRAELLPRRLLRLRSAPRECVFEKVQNFTHVQILKRCPMRFAYSGISLAR